MVAAALSALVVAAWLGACVPTYVAPMAPREKLQLEEDETRLWLQAEKGEERLLKSDLVYADPALESYVNAVSQRLIGSQHLEGIEFHVRVLKNPRLNAFALPNGSIYVHAGMFARMRNESQLAVLLGHEMSHVTHRHALQNLRSTKNKSAFFSTLGILASPAGGAGQLVTLLGAAATLSSMYGYSRDLEREADLEGFRLAAAEGYDVAQAPELFVAMRDYLKEEESDKKDAPPYFFSSHPQLQERIDSFHQLLEDESANANPIVPIRDPDRFVEELIPVLIEDASAELRIGRANSARITMERVLERRPDDVPALCLLGKALAQRKQEGDEGHAVEALERALVLNPSYGEALRVLGMIYYRSDTPARALPYFKRYLEVEPESPDHAYIEEYIEHLEPKDVGS